MSNFKVYAAKDGSAFEEYASFEDDGYKAQIQQFFDRKQRDNVPFDSADKIIRLVILNDGVIKKSCLKKMMRSLRRLDEVGLSNDIYDVLEEIEGDGSYEFIAFGDSFDGKVPAEAMIAELHGLEV